MLTELKLTNFRTFDDEVTVRFRPITVLIGKNNAGKSSIIKFLLMLQQSLDFDSPKLLTPDGPKVHLGDFSNFKNSKSKRESLMFELTVTNKRSIGDALRRYLELLKTECSEEHMLYATHAVIPYSDDQRQAMEHDAKILFNFREILGWNRLPSDNDSRLLDFSDNLQAEQQEQIELNAQKNMVDVLRHNINSIKHLLPARKEPERVTESSPVPSGDVGQSGHQALPHLQRINSAKESSAYQLIFPYIQSIAGIKQISFEEMPEPAAPKCFAINKVTGAKSYIADFGFGVSQCMPIFVQGAIMPDYSHLMVEQPEAQLHPTAQLEMGSFFADLWKKRRVGSIIETHSDNILLRLRRLIATGKLTAEEVSVAYFNHDTKNKNMPTIENLDVSKDGSIREGLPAEFFGENLREVLEMGARE